MRNLLIGDWLDELNKTVNENQVSFLFNCRRNIIWDVKLIKKVHCVSVLELSKGERAHLDVRCFLVEIAVLDLRSLRCKHNPPTTLFDLDPLDQMRPWVAVVQFKPSWCCTI